MPNSRNPEVDADVRPRSWYLRSYRSVRGANRVKISASTYRCESMCRMSSGLKSSQQEGNSMIAYQSTLLGRTEVAEDTMAFRFETLQRRDSVILSFCSTRTATWKMLRSWMHSGSWSGLILGSGLFLPSRASPRITGDGRERLDTSARKCSPRT